MANTRVSLLSPLPLGDHGLGYSILVAGSTASQARSIIRDTLGGTFVRAAEYAVARNSKDNPSRTFVSNSSQGTNTTLIVDEEQPGLRLESYYVNRLESLGSSSVARLYPTGLYSDTQSLASLYKTNETILTAHSIIICSLPLHPRAAVEGGKGSISFTHFFGLMNIGFLGATDQLPSKLSTNDSRASRHLALNLYSIGSRQRNSVSSTESSNLFHQFETNTERSRFSSCKPGAMVKWSRIRIDLSRELKPSSSKADHNLMFTGHNKL